MRRLIADLRPSTLDQLGLGPALEALGERTASGSAIEVKTSIDLDFEAGRSETRLRGEVEDTAYRLVQEALNNALHHGEAAHIAIEISEEDSALRLRVTDDGKGFDPSAPAGGFGLIGMRERAELAGGTLELLSTPGGGTTISAVIPTAYRDSPGAADAA
jgi:two-component system sensor histidine kinase DegS